MRSLYEENTELRDINKYYSSSINLLNDQLIALTKDRNKFRSQAIMRANKIEELQNELQEIYSKTSD
jgi:predicted nuclease with TOPRIM domain